MLLIPLGESVHHAVQHYSCWGPPVEETVPFPKRLRQHCPGWCDYEGELILQGLPVSHRLLIGDGTRRQLLCLPRTKE